MSRCLKKMNNDKKVKLIKSHLFDSLDVLKELQLRSQKRDKILTIRTTKEKHTWMKQHNVSPTKLFNKALEELQEKTK